MAVRGLAADEGATLAPLVEMSGARYRGVGSVSSRMPLL
jgi:hypothetical protein